MLTRKAILCAAIVMAAASGAAAQGLVIPDEPDLPPLAMTRHAVRVEIDNPAARTTVEQLFVNHTERRLEAQYVFPIPKGAVVSKFVMTVDGKEIQGEIVEKDRAQKIYQQLIHKTQNPALLEYMGSDVFRASLAIAPQGQSLVSLRFDEILTAQHSLVSYTYPVRHGTKRGPTIHGEFTIEAVIRSQIPITNVYSPSHAVKVSRPSENEARVSFSDKRTTLEKNFQVYYSLSDKQVGLSILAYRPNPKEPGYFMLLAAPRARIEPDRVIERDVLFVIDTSGSMAGEKFRQAMNALKYCITRLNDGDRFNIIRFSSFVEPWRKQLASAAKDRQAALSWVETLIAEGGTDIAGALSAALAIPRDSNRPFFTIFMTDGKPTVGETTDPRQIMAKVQNARSAAGGESIRIFTWGVGYDVDTHLLDGIAEIASGVSEYVQPKEDIEAKVSAFYNKASRPVLTNLELKVVGDKVQLVNIYPRQVPDLYAGSQLVLLGRYTGEGDVALQLTGRVNDKTETFVYEAKFPAKESGFAFMEPLWAKRRIGYLLDMIRLHGETKELVDDVIRLSKEYGIQTPYTSYITLPQDDARLSSAGRGDRHTGGLAVGAPRPEGAKRDALDKLAQRSEPLPPPAPKPAAPAEPPKAAQEAERKLEEEQARERAESLAQGFKAKDGKAAVETAGYLRRLKEADAAGDEKAVGAFRKVGEVRFFQYRDLWVDERFEADFAVTTVKFGSKAYFRLIEKRPELLEILKTANELVYVTAKGKALVISSAGEEELTDAQIAELFTPVKK